MTTNTKKEPIKEKVEKMIGEYTLPQRAEVELALGMLRGGAVEVLLAYGKGELSDEEFDEEWQRWEGRFQRMHGEASNLYLEKMREAVYRGRDDLKKEK